MKRIILIFIVITGLGFMTSCEKDDKEPVLNIEKSVSPQLITPEPGETYDLEELTVAEDSITFEWTEAEYDLDRLPSIRYRVQAYVPGNNEGATGSVVDITDTDALEATIASGEINRALSGLDVPPFTPENIAFRVMAYINLESDATWIYSDPVELQMTIFELIEQILVPGSYQGWDYENENTSLLTPEEDGGFFPDYEFAEGEYFEGYFYFEEENTEILFSFPGADGVDEWGDDAGDGNLDPEGSEIVVEEPGVYRIIVMLDDYTYVVEEADWALIGDAAEGWGTDVPMNVDVEHYEETWNLRYTITREMEEGYFKFRANEAWDPPDGMNLGMDEDPDAEEGDLIYGGFGNDIPINTPDTYTITLDLTGPVYRYEVE